MFKTQKQGDIDSMFTKLWEAGGLSPRAIDVINQCRYLASKRGMTIKEIRRSMRDDEARQLEITRQRDMESCNQAYFVSPSGLVAGVPTCNNNYHPSWYAHANNHGMIYSQFNVHNYGQIGSSPNSANFVEDTWHKKVTTKKQYNSYTRSPLTYNREKEVVQEKQDTSSEEDLTKQMPPKGVMSNDSLASDCDSRTEENVVNLLYSANENLKNKSKPNEPAVLKPVSKKWSCISEVPSELSSLNCLPVNNVGTTIQGTTNPIVPSNSFGCNPPVRKMALHDLTSLQASEELELDDDLSVILLSNTECHALHETTSSDSENDLDFSELDKSEAFTVELPPRPNGVVSPMLKKVESAFADLQKKDSLFGNLDDFGKIMNNANMF